MTSKEINILLKRTCLYGAHLFVFSMFLAI